LVVSGGLTRVVSLRPDGAGGSSNTRQVLQADSVSRPRFSPDGRWIVYRSNGIFIQPYPGPGRRLQVAGLAGSNGDGPLEWRADGKEIVFGVFDKGQFALWSAADTNVIHVMTRISTAATP